MDFSQNCSVKIKEQRTPSKAPQKIKEGAMGGGGVRLLLARDIKPGKNSRLNSRINSNIT